MRSLALQRSYRLIRFSTLIKCSAFLIRSVFDAPEILGVSKFTFPQDLDEGIILILLIPAIYTVLDDNNGDES
jgi:hypothetical protein